MNPKRIILFFFFSIFGSLGYSQETGFLFYDKEYQFEGRVEKVKYSLPSGEVYETFILQIEKPIFINANKDWEEMKNVKELHLNISNPKIEIFEDKEVMVKGLLFHALTIHHVRNACIKIEKIIEK